MGLPGLPRDGVGIRQKAPHASGLEQALSLSAASIDKISAVNYGDGSQMRQGSSSMILDDEGAAQPAQGVNFPNRPSDQSGFDGYNTNITADGRLLGNSDVSMIKFPNAPNDQELVFKKHANSQ